MAPESGDPMRDFMNDEQGAHRIKLLVGCTILIAAGIYAAVWVVQNSGAI